jgi:threonine dehydrogenase-like Zn-dependent dehydrogenase
MQALQMVGPRCFMPVRVPMPDLKTGERGRILVRPEWLTMCGSDVSFFTGGKRHQSYPLPPGAPIHECMGEIILSTAEGFQPGDRVVAIPEGNQGLAEFFTAQDAKAVKLPPHLNDEGASCLIQPLSTVINAVDRLGNVAGKSVTVVGLGSIGLFFCWLLNKSGAANITGIDPSASRCRMAERLGATGTFAMHGIEFVHKTRQNPEGWDPPEICIEAVGHQQDTLNDCFSLIRKRGTVLAFGVPDQPVYAVEYETFFRKNATLLAVVTPDWTEFLVKARDLFLACREELALLVTHRFPIREAAKAFSLYERHGDGILKPLLDAAHWQTPCP